MNRRETQDSHPSADSDTIESLALQKAMRRGVNKIRSRRRNPVGRDDLQREPLEGKQVAPSGDGQQDVMIGPVGGPRRQSQIEMLCGEQSSKKS